MRMIHLIDSLEKINFGIWNTILVNAEVFARLGWKTEIWFPGESRDVYPGTALVPLDSLSRKGFEEKLSTRKPDASRDVILSHGCWQYPTRWGAWFQRLGFRWMYIPHGMLEPWSLQHKRLKKRIYYTLVEGRLASSADWIRAVSSPEKENLQRLFSQKEVLFIPNGVRKEETVKSDEGHSRKRYLFLSRLHKKKNIAALLRAWTSSFLNDNGSAELLIAGPDQGELNVVRAFERGSCNIRYLGSVYGEEKVNLMHSCDFYLLPSFSEGLPSSLLEAMLAGLVPIITRGCNLPEVEQYELGIITGEQEADIRTALEASAAWEKDKIIEHGRKCVLFVENNFLSDTIAKRMDTLFGIRTDQPSEK